MPSNWMLLNFGGAATFDAGGIHFLGMNKASLLVDFGRSLAGTNRAGGRFYWSVAQHSLLVAHLLPPNLRLEGLLHDAHEAITGDIPTPFARWLPEEVRKTLDQGKRLIQTEFESRIGYQPWPEPPQVGSIAELVHRADHRAFLTEVTFNLAESAQTAYDELNLLVEAIEVDDSTRAFVEQWQPMSRETVAWQWASEVKVALDKRREAIQGRGQGAGGDQGRAEVRRIGPVEDAS